MRNALRLALLGCFVAAGGCNGGKSGGTGGTGGTGGGGTAGSGGGGGTTSDGSAFTLSSTPVMINAGQEVTYCYYFHTPNTDTLAVNKWVSAMTPGSHHMIMFLNPGGTQPPDGTIDTNCGIGGGSSGANNVPVWTYATQTPTQEEDLPSDDGNGKPLAQNIAPNSAGYFQMHYLNATTNALMAHVDLKAYALPAGADYTQTEAYITYNNDISIPPGATGFNVTASCPVPAGVKFWTMSTHSHKQSVATQVMDGSSMIFSSTDWEHPGAALWAQTPFYTFSATNVTWTCTYDNTGTNSTMTVKAGPSAQTNEMCMATGYFFPATGPKFGYVTGGKCYSL